MMQSLRRRTVVNGLLSLALPLPAKSEAAAGEEAYFIIAGQSNAMCAGTTGENDFPRYFATPDPMVEIWGRYQRRFQRYIAGQTSNSDQTDSVPQFWGPEAEFSRLYRNWAPSSKLSIIKRAKGNSFLSRDNGTTSPTWHPDDAGGYYHELIDQVQKARVAWSKEGKRPKPLGLLWIQGENDSSHSGTAGAYKENLSYLASRVRSDLALPNLRIAVSKVSAQQSARWKYVDLVRQAQDEFVAVDDNAVAVDTENLSFAADGVHFDAASTVTLGERLFHGLNQK